MDKGAIRVFTLGEKKLFLVDSQDGRFGDRGIDGFGRRNFRLLKSIRQGDRWYNAQFHHTDVAILDRMREKLFCSIFLCNGGWYLLAGDEYGVLHRPLVFSNYRENRRLETRWGGREDLTELITNLNTILHRLPVAARGDRTELNVILVDQQPVRYALRHSASTNQQFILTQNGARLQESDVTNTVFRARP